MTSELEKEYIEKRLHTLMQPYDVNMKDLMKGQKEFHKEFQLFVERVGPMLKAFEDSQQTKIVWTNTGVTIKKTAQWIMVVGGAGTVIWIFFKFVFLGLVGSIPRQ